MIDEARSDLGIKCFLLRPFVLSSAERCCICICLGLRTAQNVIRRYLKESTENIYGYRKDAIELFACMGPIPYRIIAY